MHMQTIAKIFKSGNSQAVRLPKDFRLKGKTVRLTKTPDGVMLVDEESAARRAKAFAALYGSCPHFPELERS
jgi:antitoxin VapB